MQAYYVYEALTFHSLPTRPPNRSTMDTCGAGGAIKEISQDKWLGGDDDYKQEIEMDCVETNTWATLFVWLF